MRDFFDSVKKHFDLIIGIIFALLLFWFVLFLKSPYHIIQFFQAYSFTLFLFVLITYYLIYRLPRRLSIVFGLGFTLLLLALTLVFKWTSGYSDNFLIGGMLPYKDAKNFFMGANLILNGFPLEEAGQASERPLFPGFLSAVFLLTGANLKLSLAMLTQLAGIGLYYSSLRVFRSFGALSASLYSSLLFFYIQPWIGYTMSEVFGFFIGCVAFSLLWFASENHEWSDLIIGLVILLVAVSARAGAFFIFPLLIIWTGWMFRDNKQFSIKASIYAALIISIAYFTVNVLYPQLVGVPKESSFGNFSYALYGQVRGGTGWHSAIEDLGTRDPAIVYEAAFDFFRRHPLSLLIGFVKSYRDFFLPGLSSIFPFAVSSQPTWITYSLWFGTIIALFFGVYRLLKHIHENLSLLLLAGFVGIFLSIPFLPPIDGGSRFYASTIPFFMVIPAIGLSKAVYLEPYSLNKGTTSRMLKYSSVVLIFLTVIAPILIYSISKRKLTDTYLCASSQQAYIIQINPGSYLDFIQDEESYCGMVPDICMSDFRNNNSEFKTDDFYQEIYSMMKTGGVNARLIPSINLIDREFHYFFVDTPEITEHSSGKTISGCAIEVRTKNQSIYVVKSISSEK